MASTRPDLGPYFYTDSTATVRFDSDATVAASASTALACFLASRPAAAGGAAVLRCLAPGGGAGSGRWLPIEDLPMSGSEIHRNSASLLPYHSCAQHRSNAVPP
jgi:hypothetical protein